MSNNTAWLTITFKLTTTSIISSVSTLFFYHFWMAYQTMINAAVSRQKTPNLQLTPSLICLARARIPWMSPVDNIYCINIDVAFPPGRRSTFKNVTSRVKNVTLCTNSVWEGVTFLREEWLWVLQKTIKNEYKNPRGLNPFHGFPRWGEYSGTIRVILVTFPR